MDFQQRLKHLARIIDWHLEPRCKHVQAPSLDDDFSKTTKQPFPFLQLPQELQDLVYLKYLAGVCPTLPRIKHDNGIVSHAHRSIVRAVEKQLRLVRCRQPACQSKGRCRCREEVPANGKKNEQKQDIPCLNLELTCRKVCIDVRQVRGRQWPRELTFEVADWARLAQPNAKWLQQRLTKLFMTASSFEEVNPYSARYLHELAQSNRCAIVWKQIAEKCPQLRLVLIEAEREFLDYHALLTIDDVLSLHSDWRNKAAGNDLSLYALPRALGNRKDQVRIRFRSLVVHKVPFSTRHAHWLFKAVDFDVVSDSYGDGRYEHRDRWFASTSDEITQYLWQTRGRTFPQEWLENLLYRRRARLL